MFRNLIWLILLLGGVVLAQRNLTQPEINSIIGGLFKKDPSGTTLTPPISRVVEMPQQNLTEHELNIIIGEIFTSDNRPTKNDCPGGNCVPFRQCSNNTFATDGNGLIDLRFDKNKPQRCVDYLEICCGLKDKLVTPVPLTPRPQTKLARCGYRNTNGVGFRISLKDGDSEYAEFPWMVAIWKKEIINSKVLEKYHCGGSLIHAKVVLTAAHCTQNQNANMLKIRASEWDTHTENEIYPHQDRDVGEIIVHSQYYKGGLYNDISLLILSEPIKFDENIQTICLPPQNTVFDHNRCTASGWGKDVIGRQESYQVILKKVDLPIVPRVMCEESISKARGAGHYDLHESFICAGGELGKDTCKGDGGSPLVCPINSTIDRYYQSGIVSWGIGCGENQVPGVYTNVAQFRNWIDGNFLQRALDSSSYSAS